MQGQPKKMAILNILDVLCKYTDFDHRLTQKEIQNLLESEYDMKIDRKSVKRNLMDLVAYGYNIEFDIIIRKKKNGEEEEIATNWFLIRDFSDSELKLLIDSISFSKEIPRKQGHDLIMKLAELSSKNFDVGLKEVHNKDNENKSIKQLFSTLEVLNEAMSKNQKVSFCYNYYDVDKKLYPRINEQGEAIEYIVNPIETVIANGKHYLIGNYDKYDNISHYRIDRITEARLIEKPAKARRNIKGLEKGLNLSKHMAEHVYMFSGESERVEFKSKRSQVTEIIDWFGEDITFTDVTEDDVTVSLITNIGAFRYWALQYSRFISVTYPKRLVTTIKNDLKEAYERYI